MFYVLQILQEYIFFRDHFHSLDHCKLFYKRLELCGFRTGNLNFNEYSDWLCFYKGRALTAHAAETDAVQFFVGTQSLRCENQVSCCI